MHETRLRRRSLLLAALLVAVAAGIRIAVVHRDYALLGIDTFPLILAGRLESAGDVFRLFTRPLLGEGHGGVYYRPLLHLVLGLEHALFGLRPFPYQAVNALGFAAAGLAVWRLGTRLLPERARLASLVGLVLFLVHPAQAAVLPVPARLADTLCVLFMSLALAADARHAAEPRRRVPLAPALFAVLALASKETAFVLPALSAAVAMGCAPQTAKESRAARVAAAVGPQLLVAVAMLAVRLAVLGDVVGQRPVPTEGIVAATALTAGRVATGLLDGGGLVAAALVGCVFAFAAAMLWTRERSALLEASLRSIVVSLVWLAAVTAVYAVAFFFFPWYLLIPAAGLALGVTGVVAGLGAALSRGSGSVRALAGAGMLCAVAFVALLAAGSPLFRAFPDWERASQRSDTYLARLAARIEAAAPGTAIQMGPPPGTTVSQVTARLGAAPLADYSVDAWVRLRFPGRRLRVTSEGDPEMRPRPGEVVVVLGRWRGSRVARPVFGKDRTPPNLVLILADDLGVGDLGTRDGVPILTPNLDALAAGGVRFTQGYASAPVCAPMRAGLLTGRDANRFQYTRTTGTYQRQRRLDIGLARRERLLSEDLRAAGYATAAIGKWHLGVNPHYRPRARGFDSFFGFLAGAHRYFDWSGGIFGPVFRDDLPVEGSEYLTDAFSREAVAFIEARAASGKQPFFLYLAYSAVHGPLEAPDHYLAGYAELPQAARAVPAMTTAMDAGIGRVLDALRRAGVEESTLVVFLSDNGGLSPFSSNGSLRGGKGLLYEGGIRVPFLARWPAALPAGARFDLPVSSLDVLPTLLAAAGLAAPPARRLDGVNLLPYVRGRDAGMPHDALTWRSDGHEAIRQGRWKLVRGGGRVAAELFDLVADVGERRDLRAARPEVAERIGARLDAWVRTLPPEAPAAAVQEPASGT